MKAHHLTLIGLGITSLLACTDSEGSATHRTVVSSEGVIDTTALYAQRCATCHGMNGAMRMGGAIKLTESTAGREEIIGQIRYGKGTMPPFEQMLSTEQIEALADYAIAFRSKEANR
jgi:mono/diheme cytochrome c family protein